MNAEPRGGRTPPEIRAPGHRGEGALVAQKTQNPRALVTELGIPQPPTQPAARSRRIWGDEGLKIQALQHALLLPFRSRNCPKVLSIEEARN